MMTPQEALQQFCPEQLVVSPEKQTAVAAVAPLSSDTEETETSSPEEEEEDNDELDEDDKAPSHFICPLTLQIMRDPVLSRYGQNYERCAILEWLTSSNGHGSCPLTRRPLELRGLVSNHNLRCQIRQWQQQRDDHDDDDENTHTPMKDDEEPHSAYFLLDWNDQAEHTDEDPPLILEYRPGNAAAMATAASVERQQPTNRRQRRRRGFLGRLRRAVGASL